MELRQYWAVVRRRWPLVAAIVGLTALFSLGLLYTQKPAYTAFTRLAIRQRALPAIAPTPGPAGQPGVYTYDRYYNFYSSEFLADDYAIIVTSRAFQDLVAEKMGRKGQGLPGSLATDRKQRELSIMATAADSATAVQMAQAAGQVFTDLSQPGASEPNRNGVLIPDDAVFAVIDGPNNGNEAASNRSRQYANVAIAAVVGLALALALAFLVEYFDTSLRDSADAEAVIGLPVLGTIPGHK